MKNDEVKGSHYQNFAIQPKDYIAANNLNFFCGNAVKYVSRYPYKNGLQDLSKAIDNIQYEMERYILEEIEHKVIVFYACDVAMKEGTKIHFQNLIRDAIKYCGRDRTVTIINSYGGKIEDLYPLFNEELWRIIKPLGEVFMKVAINDEA